MIEVKKGKDYLNLFENISELSRYVNRERKPGRCNSSDEEDYGFYGTKNFNEALELLKYGDEKLYEKVKEERAKIKIDNLLGKASNKRVYFNNVCGYIPNVPNYLIGSPLSMIDMKKVESSQRIVNIFLNIRVCGGVDANDVIKIGTKYLSVIDLIEKSGYRCNLYSGVANASGYTDRHSCLMTRIKTDREPLNIKKICFAVANPSMQRRIKFRWQEVNDDSHDFSHDGYGGPENQSYIEELLERELGEKFIIWNYESNNKSKPIEEIVKDLKNYGININI